MRGGAHYDLIGEESGLLLEEDPSRDFGVIADAEFDLAVGGEFISVGANWCGVPLVAGVKVLERIGGVVEVVEGRYE